MSTDTADKPAATMPPAADTRDLRWLPPRPPTPHTFEAVTAEMETPAGALARAPAIDGLNAARGLGFMGDRIDLYRRALTRFVQCYGTPWTELDDAIAARDWPRCVHCTFVARRGGDHRGRAAGRAGG